MRSPPTTWFDPCAFPTRSVSDRLALLCFGGTSRLLSDPRDRFLFCNGGRPCFWWGTDWRIPSFASMRQGCNPPPKSPPSQRPRPQKSHPEKSDACFASTSSVSPECACSSPAREWRRKVLGCNHLSLVGASLLELVLCSMCPTTFDSPRPAGLESASTHRATFDSRVHRASHTVSYTLCEFAGNMHASTLPIGPHVIAHLSGHDGMGVASRSSCITMRHENNAATIRDGHPRG